MGNTMPYITLISSLQDLSAMCLCSNPDQIDLHKLNHIVLEHLQKKQRDRNFIIRPVTDDFAKPQIMPEYVAWSPGTAKILYRYFDEDKNLEEKIKHVYSPVDFLSTYYFCGSLGECRLESDVMLPYIISYYLLVLKKPISPLLASSNICIGNLELIKKYEKDISSPIYPYSALGIF